MKLLTTKLVLGAFVLGLVLPLTGCGGNKVEMPTGSASVPKEPPAKATSPKLPEPPKQ